ncbi:MAG: hypothetical protein QW056_02505 [Candidatus Bathyarchaeia archaeon]
MKRLRKYFGQMMNFSDQNVHITSILIALIVVSTLLVYSYTSINKNNEYINFYILDQNKRAERYPEIVILGKNNTFTVWVVVENYMRSTLNGKVLLKITDKPISTFPVPVEPNQSICLEINSSRSSEAPVEITLNSRGRFSLVFELWMLDEKSGEFEFRQFLVLNVDVKEED